MASSFMHTVLLALVAASAADIVVSRTVNTLAAGSAANVTIEGSACAKSDAHGSDACDVQWGSTYVIDYDVTLGEDLTEGAQVHVNMKLDHLSAHASPCP